MPHTMLDAVLRIVDSIPISQSSHSSTSFALSIMSVTRHGLSYMGIAILYKSERGDMIVEWCGDVPVNNAAATIE